jgi:hypothetical protein
MKKQRKSVVYMRRNAPSPPEKVLDFQGLFSFSQLKNPLQAHTDIKITISLTGSTQKCVLFCFRAALVARTFFSVA